ncbi:DUF6069 family protein [Polymorphospora sp. NPDC050346]|uniref:DUF6069 family protein n=1 Tax=Polymorphospora sp. NPDC050346 TaxID=3155780 RepID=UPI0033CF634A
MNTIAALARRLGRPGVVAATVLLAVVVNLIIYAIGRGAGATYVFTAGGQSTHVEPLTLVGFTAVPLAVGLTAAVLLSRWWHWVIPVALVVAPVLALLSIPAMTLPSDLDTTGKIALALCHVTLAPISVAGLLAIRSLTQPAAPPLTAAS